jgi:hypothetical protein
MDIVRILCSEKCTILCMLLILPELLFSHLCLSILKTYGEVFPNQST